MTKKTGVWIIVGIIVIVAVIGFFIFYGSDGEKVTQDTQSSGSGAGSEQASADDETNIDWLNYELKDIKTGDTFKISDFSGKPILLESFAVWCPTCTSQQKKIKELHDEVGDSVVSISLDTDQSEDESRVLNHIESHGFNWYYAISPIELTESLIDEFGNSFVSAPSVPIVLICEDGTYRKLGGFGVRNVDKLKDEIAAGCS